MSKRKEKLDSSGSQHDINSHQLYMDKIVSSPHFPRHPLSTGTRKDIIPKTAVTGISSQFEDIPMRPVNPDGEITEQYLMKSGEAAGVLARKLLRLESRRFPPNRRFGEKLDRLIEAKKISDTKSEEYFNLKKSEINIHQFSGINSADQEGSFFEEHKPQKSVHKKPIKFYELPHRPKQIYNKDSLFQCMLDSTVITVEPRSILADSRISPGSKKWATGSILMSMADSAGEGSISTQSLASGSSLAPRETSHKQNSLLKKK